MTLTLALPAEGRRNPRLVNGRGLGVDLRRGEMYRLVLHHQAGNYRWVTQEMHARFIGVHDTAAYPGGSLDFDLRPAFGTTEVPVRWIRRADVSRARAPVAPRPLLVDSALLLSEDLSPANDLLRARLRLAARS